MNTYQKLETHLTTFVYKRGQYKGDAPVDTRRKTDFRVVRMLDALVVRKYNTDIITAYPDGRVMISLDGWEDSSTTRRDLNDALWRFCPAHIRMFTRSVFSQNQCVIAVHGHTYYRYTNRMLFDESGRLLSEPAKFQARRIDKEESKELSAGLKASGFLEMFPFLYTTATFEDRKHPSFTPRADMMQMYLSDYEYADRWQDLIGMFKFEYGFYRKGDVRYEMQPCLNAMLAYMKKGMYRLIDTDIVRITHDNHHTTVSAI